MSKYDIRKNKEMPSDEEINKYKNFDKVLNKSAIYDYKKATKPLYKNVKFLGIIAALVAIGLIFLFESDEETGIHIQQVPIDSIKKDTSHMHSTIPINVPSVEHTNIQTGTQTATGRSGITETSGEDSAVNHPQNGGTHATSTYMPASFPGGETALSAFLNKHIKYPYNAVETPYSGKVEVTMTLESSGEIVHVHILHSPNVAITHEINRVIKLMPKWNPAKTNDKPVTSKVTVFFPFAYQED